MNPVFNRPKAYLIDGHALIYRMHYAFERNPMINQKGQNTSVLYGFVKYILDLLENERPDYFAVAFDPKGGSFRKQINAEYKANRRETPQLVRDAFLPLQELCESFGIPVLIKTGYEADDVIGSMAKALSRQGLDVYMLSPDKDYGQLIEEHIFQHRPSISSSKDDEILGVEELCKKYNISHPLQIIDFLSICGDKSDNVKGVNGVGPAGATKLLAKFGSLQGIYENIDQIKGKQKENLIQAQDHIQESKTLVTIVTDLDVSEWPLESMKVGGFNDKKIKKLFSYYEFYSLRKNLNRLEAIWGPDLYAVQIEKEDNRLSITEISLDNFIKLLSKSRKFSYEIEVSGKSIFSKIEKIALFTNHENQAYFCKLNFEDNKETLRELFSNKNLTICGYELKFFINLLEYQGISLDSKLHDIELMHYVFNPEANHSLPILAHSYLNEYIEEEAVNLENSNLFEQNISFTSNLEKQKKALNFIYKIDELLWKDLEDKDLTELYEDLEEPLLRVLAKMERNGVKVDIASLANYAKELEAEIKEKEALIREYAEDMELNVSSPKQLGELLFEKLKLKENVKKNRNGSYSTDESVLQELLHVHPIIELILDFRAVKKLHSTYVLPFANYVSPVSCRVHTTYNQALTATGRLSSSNPNLQNIPIRTPRGKRIREVFVAEQDDNYILSADYSQIELRIMADISGDENMIEAFRRGEDIHAATAAKIYDIELADVTPEQRRVAKTVNFGIIYGISPFGLAERLQIPIFEAKKIIEDYFKSFPRIEEYIAETLDFARKNGYVQTIFGRRRYIANINAENGNLRAFAERNAINAPIQGSAADIIKLAMINVDKRMVSEGIKSKMLLQIHDELVFEVVAEELDKMRSILVEEMEKVVKLNVSLKVECNYGKNWLEAH